jgi:hypothetical protein
MAFPPWIGHRRQGRRHSLLPTAYPNARESVLPAAGLDSQPPNPPDETLRPGMFHSRNERIPSRVQN